jgi:hypothetical protein
MSYFPSEFHLFKVTHFHLEVCHSPKIVQNASVDDFFVSLCLESCLFNFTRQREVKKVLPRQPVVECTVSAPANAIVNSG